LLKEKRVHEVQEQREREQVYGFVLGMPGDGLRPEVLAAPIQMKHLSDSVVDLVDVVNESKESNDKVVSTVGELANTVKGFRASLSDLDKKVSTVVAGTATLVHESKTNGGTSMRDAIDEQGRAIGEMQVEQGRVRDEKADNDKASG
jgi:uncharacterized protein YoxC